MSLLTALLATLLVSFVSFFAVIVLHKRIDTGGLLITVLVSFAAGSLLGDIFLHLLPEHIEQSRQYTTFIAMGILAGIIMMLLVESYLHCSHDSKNELENNQKENFTLALMNIIGDGIHNFLDGIAIGASFLVNPATGIASTIAVILHEIPQEIADASILVYSGWKAKKILVINFLTALTAVIGCLLVFVFHALIENLGSILVPLAIGQFLYIALADLVPVIHKKTGWGKYLAEISAFIFGICIIYLLTFIEV